MSESTTNFRALPNGKYKIYSREKLDGQPQYLSVIPGTDHQVGLNPSGDFSTTWSPLYEENSGSYLIYENTTDRVLDATPTWYHNVLTWGRHNGLWQRWVIRLQRISNPKRRVTGWTLTPLSQPPSVLSVPVAAASATPVPAQLLRAPPAEEEIGLKQLWIFEPLDEWRKGRRASAFAKSGEVDSEPVEEEQPGESGEAVKFDVGCYCDEIQALIAQARDQLAAHGDVASETTL
ncbi:hypothetical protein FRC04_009854 [Tulasnella sp. 424]|nr:hypothetical protein FRC04_009854 [Tulasnella sp. 424]